jgi:hypothetical protein
MSQDIAANVSGVLSRASFAMELAMTPLVITAIALYYA